MTNILLVGSKGRMGKAIIDVVAARDDVNIAAEVDMGIPFPANADGLDAIIDFSNPAALDGVLSFALKYSLPVVFATTGYSDEQLAKIKEASAKIPIFFSGNMSMGINLLSALAKKAAEILGAGADIEIIEKHHNQKLDAPSGTALLLADAINEGGEYEYKYNRHDFHEKRSSKEIGIHSVRGGTIVGEHEVIFAMPNEVITLSHSAENRGIFAAGAVNAACWLANQTAGYYDMGDLINS